MYHHRGYRHCENSRLISWPSLDRYLLSRHSDLSMVQESALGTCENGHS